jgi:amino acid transporter
MSNEATAADGDDAQRPIPGGWFRRLIFGTPFETSHAHHTRLPNWMALPVFASDALSSVSYATEEMLLVLVLAGTTGVVLGVSWPIAIVIAGVLAIVVASYRLTVRAYPQGGGDYRVSRENLGIIPGLTVASSLLLDYVLTVAVSISAGVAALTSAVPALQRYTVWIAVGFIIFIGLANLRGAKESGLLFAIPTYLFIGSIIALLVVGFTRLAMGHNLTPPAPPENSWAHAGTSLSLFLILRAFTSGCTALTGVEAITDGVPAFRPPEAKNAAKVLAILGVILVTMFLGLTFLANQIHVVPFPVEMEGHGQHRHTVVSQIASAVFGGGVLYYVVQAATAAILILAANTAFVDFPRLASYLGQDRFLPRQMANLGDRLVYSNGIIGLTVFAIGAVVAFGASTHHLIPLYAFGVFLSFTLGQTGMVVRWFRLKPAGWKLGALISGIGAAATAVVLVIIAITKFMAGDPVHFWPITTQLGLWSIVSVVTFVLLSMYHRWMGKWFLGLSVLGFLIYWAAAQVDVLAPVDVRLGAWVVMAAIPALVWMCFRINAHYKEVATHLTMQRYEDVPDFRHTVLVLVGGLHRGVMPAVKYARSIGGDVRAVYVEIEPEKTPDVLQRWRNYVPDLPLVVLDSPYRALTAPLLRYIDEVEQERDDDIVTVVIPEFVTEKWWTKLLHGQNGLLLKWALLFRKGVVVTNIRYYLDADGLSGTGHVLASKIKDEAPEEEPASTPATS